MTDRIFSHQFHAAEGAEAWRVLPEGAYAFFRADSFGASARFVDAIGGLLRESVAPDVDIRRDGVTVLLGVFKGEHFGLLQRDLDLARSIATTANDMGLTAGSAGDPEPVDHPGRDRATGDHAVLAERARVPPRPNSPDEDLVDSHGRGAPFWFEEPA